MIALLGALTAGYGVFLIYTAVVMHWTGVSPGPRVEGEEASPVRHRIEEWMTQAGLGEVRPSELGIIAGTLGTVGGALSYAMFGSAFPSLAVGLFAASYPVAAARSRRARRLADAREAWPRIIEEIRVLTGSAGRSIPQALFEAGLAAPEAIRPGFAAAQREWLLTTDFELTIAVLKSRLADATADVACETLLVAHQVGGSDVDRRLAALVEDRTQDLRGRKDAEARQAGVRFARRFVLIVPLGMAICGLSIGDGRAAYQTSLGQVAVVIAILLLAACWLWAGQIMRLPAEERVFR